MFKIIRINNRKIIKINKIKKKSNRKFINVKNTNINYNRFRLRNNKILFNKINIINKKRSTNNNNKLFISYRNTTLYKIKFIKINIFYV